MPPVDTVSEDVPYQVDKARLKRALKERIYLLGPAPAPTETSRSFLVSGQSGKVYTTTLHLTTVDTAPTCNCVDQRIRKSVCKHILFIASRVLKLPISKLGRPSLTQAQAHKYSDSSAVLQAAGAHAAPAKLRDSVEQAFGALSSEGAQKVPPRGPEEDEECPVCFERLCAEPLVHCGYGCGRAVHVECFERYVQASGSKRCVLCRAAWDPPQKQKVGRGGYLINRRLVDLSESVPELFVEIEAVRKRRRGEEDAYHPDEEEEEEVEEYDPDYVAGKKKRKKARKSTSGRNGSTSKAKAEQREGSSSEAGTVGRKGAGNKSEVGTRSGKPQAKVLNKGREGSKGGSNVKKRSTKGKQAQKGRTTTRGSQTSSEAGRCERVTRSVTREAARRANAAQ